MLNDLNSEFDSPRQRTCLRPIFDNHEKYEGKAKRMFSDFAKKNPICSQSLLPPHYEDEKQYIALQADLLP